MILVILFHVPVIVMAIYNQACNRCVNKQCEKLQCTYGCESEYYLYRFPDSFNCMPSAENKNCSSCQNRNLCTKCNDGYYVKKNVYNTSCERCPWNCLTCSSSLHCLSCKPGWVLEANWCWINLCTWNCEICTTKLVCSICKRGWYGLMCYNFCGDKIAHCASCQETNGTLTCNECDKSYSLLNATCRATSQKTSTACSAAGINPCRLSLLEADIPSADNYYNGDGLFGSSVKVSDLLGYVERKTDFDSEFQKLPKGIQGNCNEALKTHNREKNRFDGIYAYDATRVVLGSESYINANYIDGHSQSNAYIASVGPTSDTMNKFSTFWEMIWQEEVEAIVMLTNLEERGKMKCEQYWPDPGTTKTCHDYIVKCGAENVFAEFAVRELTLERNGFSERLNLTQYHYTAWPDRHVPDTVASLVEFRDKVEHMKRRTISPLVVHGSAGIGRTGTYIALDLLINKGRGCNYVDLFGCALGLRLQRVDMIQNEEQYEYLHHAVLYSLSCYTEPIYVTPMENLMTGEWIAAQFKALKALPVPSKRLSLWTSNYADRKENRAEADVLSDTHRVKLLSSNDDYINAVVINGRTHT